jgi:hypothetical protein
LKTISISHLQILNNNINNEDKNTPTDRIPVVPGVAGAIGTIFTGAGAICCLIGTIVAVVIFVGLVVDVCGADTSRKYCTCIEKSG